METTTHLIVASGAIAAILRVVVPILKSPLANGVWGKVPKWLRPILLIGIAGVLGFLDAFAFGISPVEAILAAFAAVGAAVASYESGKGVVKMPEKPEPIK